jgi:hypothetical protein
MPKRKILYQPRRQFTKYDSSLEHGKDQVGVIIDMPKRYRLVIKSLGDFGPKGVESPNDLADYCNKRLKRQFFNKNHMAHPLKYLARVGVVQSPNGVHGWRLSPRGEDIYAQTKKIPLNK